VLHQGEKREKSDTDGCPVADHSDSGITLSDRVQPFLPIAFAMSRGAFIVIEGLDRSGKSTQSARLLERLQATSKSVQLLKFPGNR